MPKFDTDNQLGKLHEIFSDYVIRAAGSATLPAPCADSHTHCDIISQSKKEFSCLDVLQCSNKLYRCI